MAWNFCEDTKLNKLFFEIENHKHKKMQSSKVIFPLTKSHVIIKIPKEEHKIRKLILLRVCLLPLGNKFYYAKVESVAMETRGNARKIKL